MGAPFESSAPVISARLAPTPPKWVRDYLTRAQPSPLTLSSANIVDATSLSADGLSNAVSEVYRAVLREVRERHQHPVRIWNFVPSINGELGTGDRYMAFNAGRFAAFAEWFDLGAGDSVTIPTASAVGIDGTTLWIHILAAGVQGVAVENPRQVPAYRYSQRYGPRPPCFARATRFESTLFIGGTASIIGEDSRHVGDLAAQTEETLANLRSVIAVAMAIPEDDALKTVRDARIHITNSTHAPFVREALDQVMDAAANLEFVEAELCRQELLVEIEGIACYY